MPVLDLLVEQMNVVGLPAGGNLPLDPPLPGLNRVLLRRLYCWLRVPPIPGVKVAYLDTGAPLTTFPEQVWRHDFGWRAGRDYDELSVAGVGAILQGQVLGHRYSFTLARLRVPVELAGRDPKGARLRLDDLICQLADASGPPFVLLGLWGGAFTDHRLAVDRLPASDELGARLEF